VHLIKILKKSSYYAGIMLDAFANLLCWHNWRKPSFSAKDATMELYNFAFGATVQQDILTKGKI